MVGVDNVIRERAFMMVYMGFRDSVDIRWGNGRPKSSAEAGTVELAARLEDAGFYLGPIVAHKVRLRSNRMGAKYV